MKASVIKINPANPDKNTIAAAGQIVKNGGLVIFPTETVYGIAANLLNRKAIEKLYRIKARPGEKQFTVHISDVKTIRDMGCTISDAAKTLMTKFWPGPLTLILESAEGEKIGFRMPANKIALELIKASGVPVVAPSANLSGKQAPVTAREAIADLEDKVDMVIDGGRTEIGLESTVVDMTMDPFKVLRAGAVKEKELSEAANG